MRLNIFFCVMIDVRKHVQALLAGDDIHCLGAALYLMPPTLLEKAVALADQEDAIHAIKISQHVKCYSVRGKTSEYVVVPNKFCSCHFYTENVVKQHLSWTCKHDLAVQLRLRITGSVSPHPTGNDLLAQKFVCLM